MARTVTATELKDYARRVIEQAQHEDVMMLRRRRLTPERWQAIQDELKAISAQGKQDTDLAAFVAEDRLRQ